MAPRPTPISHQGPQGAGSSVPEFLDAHILLVSETPDRVAVTQALTDAGYENVKAITSIKQLSVLGAHGPDLLIVDLEGSPKDFTVVQQLGSATGARDFVRVIVLTPDPSRSIRTSALQAGAMEVLAKPVDPLELKLRVRNLLRARSSELSLRRQNEDLRTQVKERTSSLWTAMNELNDHAAQLQLSQEETLTRLARAAEFRDDETAQHVERMSLCASVIARASGRSAGEVKLIRMASRLHDIGKIGIPDSILLKPGKLDPEERALMEKHVEYGYNILAAASSQLMQTAATIAHAHHERFDGTGYPQGLKGEAIPFEGRVAAIADVFDALSMDRVYRKAFSILQAIEMMKEGRGKQFDPHLLDLFLEALPEILVLRREFAED
ncbi:MAG: cyclic di-GMP phosphodiesterase [Actinomycetota bacterium]|nr:cyclic di-GMP phosphodiesterase [Actinomycetota bacterium]